MLLHLTEVPQTDELFLNLVLEYIPETVYRVARNYAKQKQSMPILLVKVRSHLSAPIDP